MGQHTFRDCGGSVKISRNWQQSSQVRAIDQCFFEITAYYMLVELLEMINRPIFEALLMLIFFSF